MLNSSQKARKTVKGLLQALLDDCDMQANACEDGEDSWDVYDIRNWESMSCNIRRIGEFLNIKLK